MGFEPTPCRNADLNISQIPLSCLHHAYASQKMYLRNAMILGAILPNNRTNRLSPSISIALFLLPSNYDYIEGRHRQYVN